jgi:hypothetical protein
MKIFAPIPAQKSTGTSAAFMPSTSILECSQALDCKRKYFDERAGESDRFRDSAQGVQIKSGIPHSGGQGDVKSQVVCAVRKALKIFFAWAKRSTFCAPGINVAI